MAGPMSAENVALIGTMAVLTYAIRFSGLSFGDRAMPQGMRQLFDRVPIAVFAALAAPGIAGSDVDVQPRLVGAAVALVAFLVGRQFWIGLIAGMIGYGLARWAFG
jgi:branched-subunit amino acid transport protein